MTANSDDPLLYDGYPLDNEKLQKLNELLNNKIVANYKEFEYFLECYGIYDNTDK